jgi:tRNA(Ile)-lysidine synthase
MAQKAERALADTVARSLSKLPDLRGNRILLGLSGGADSTALLHALIGLRPRFHFNLIAAHVNHGLRGAESDRDEAFVRDLCARVGVALVVKRIEGLDPNAGNLEARARDARYSALTAAAESTGADYIALAHQADDQAETVMLRMLRGAGVTGLGAMAESGPGKIIRPLLGVPRSVIMRYLAQIGAAFVEDSTNASLRHDRNRLRRRLIPLLERDYASGLTERMAGLAREMRQVDDLLGTLAQAALRDCLNQDGSLDVAGFNRLHPAVAAATMRHFIAMMVGSLEHFGRPHIDSLCALARGARPNGRLRLPGRWIAKRCYGRLVLVRGEQVSEVAPAFELPLALGGVTVVEAAQTAFQSCVIDRAQLRMPRDATRAVFDAGALGGGFTVRNPRLGDRITPFGMAGSRKVKDVFIDSKIPAEQRPRFPLVLLDGSVAWIPGLVRSNLGLVSDETTEVVQLSFASRHCLCFNPRASV